MIQRISTVGKVQAFLLNMPNNMLNNIRENNQNHIINNFSIDIMLKQYDKIYLELAL